MCTKDKITVISFDETYISNKICFDKKTEQVLGPFKTVQTVIARGTFTIYTMHYTKDNIIYYIPKTYLFLFLFLGLFCEWKQPIFYEYDTSMTKQLLFDIIYKLHNCGFDVVAIVSDMGPSNMGLWKSLEISILNTSFKHPATNNNIYVFADVPHLLKLARNHFIDSGFILKNDKFIGKDI